LNIYPSQPLYWCEISDVPFGQKQVQTGIRKPSQRVQIAKEVEYLDKDAERIPQVADMPAIFDSLRIGEEEYANDPVNALGHVGDLGLSFKDNLAQYYIAGTTADPLTYGLIDAGPGTPNGTAVRPDMPTAVTTSDDWEHTPAMLNDLSGMDATLTLAGFHGPRVVLAHPLVRPFLMNLPMANTATPFGTYLQSSNGYMFDFCEYYDTAAALTGVTNVYMADASAFTIFQNPISGRAFFDDNREKYYWRWKTRGYLLAKSKHNGTDWQKGIVLCAIDLHD
jgi:hypothetical protein